MKAFSERFLRNPHLLALSVCLLIVAGGSALTNLPRIEDPRITTRNASILTVLPGASAERVEALVTKPIEDRLKELAAIKLIETTSREGFSTVNIELQDYVGPDQNETVFSEVRDALADVEQALPVEASKPDFDDKRGAVAFSLVASLSWSGPDRTGGLGTLGRLADSLADRLRSLPGTELTRIYGAPEEEITIRVDPKELAELGLTAADLSSVIRAADAKTPAGAIRTAERTLLIEVEGKFETLERIRAIPLTRNARSSVVRLGDIATVERGWREPATDMAFANQTRSVLVGVRVTPDVRVDEWAMAANRVITTFAGDTGTDVNVDIVFDQSEYTSERLGTLSANLLAGGALVMVVVFLAMGWRAALIVGAALPLSAASAVFGLTFFGQQIHQMSIFGLIVAVGLLIDNAIVVTEEVAKRLRAGDDRATAHRGALAHLATPLFASTLTTILGFMPIFLLPGNVGDFVGPIAISVVLALGSSFFISMTIIAALAARYLSVDNNVRTPRWWRTGLHSQRLAVTYRRLIALVVHRPLVTIALVCIAPVIGLLNAGSLPQQFFPSADRNQFEVEVALAAGASIERTREMTLAIDQAIRDLDGVTHTTWRVGGSYPSVYYNLVMTQDRRAAFGHGIVTTNSVSAAARLIPQLQAELTAQFPSARIIVSPFGQGPPFEAPVVFRLVGPDIERLRLLGEEIRAVLHADPAIVATAATVVGGNHKLTFVPNEDALRLAGLTASDLANQLQGRLEGQAGGTVLENLESLPVRVRLDDDERASLARVANTPVITTRPDGTREWLPAAALGDMKLTPTTASISRRNGERVNKILGFVRSDALPIVVAQRAQAELATRGFALPPGYRLETGGESEEQGKAVQSLATYVPVLIVLMVTTLVLSFRSVTFASLVGLVAILSLGLGLLCLGFSGHALGFNPMLGSLGLIGVAINGAIVVLAAIRANPNARRGDQTAIIDETVGASRHILSTTLTTVGGFVPLLISGGTFWPPLAVVIAGGVGLSVVLALGLTPAAYTWLTRKRRNEVRANEPTETIESPVETALHPDTQRARPGLPAGAT